MSNVTVKHEGRYWFVHVEVGSLGHAYKLLSFVGEPFWKSLLRVWFRPLWRASAWSGDNYVHLEENYGRVFVSRSEAVAAILAFHGISDPDYPAPSE